MPCALAKVAPAKVPLDRGTGGAYNLLEKRGELRRLAATQNKRLNSSASSKDEPKTLQTELKSRVV
jgi:hypothetical protein